MVNRVAKVVADGRFLGACGLRSLANCFLRRFGGLFDEGEII